MASIEQGMKLFTAVYKRVYRSLAKEFRKLYILNRTYLDPQVQLDILDEPLEQSDYLANEKDIIPAADPSAASQQERIQKAQMLTQFLGLGTINPMEVTQRLLEAFEEPNIEKLLQQPQPQPDPKAEALQMKAQLDQQKAANDIQMAQAKMKLQQAAEENKLQLKAAMQQQEMEFKAQEAALKMKIASLEAGVKVEGQQADTQQKLIQGQQQHMIKMRQGEEKHQAAVKQQKAKPQPKK
jgi:hypothetical protein